MFPELNGVWHGGTVVRYKILEIIRVREGIIQTVVGSTWTTWGKSGKNKSASAEAPGRLRLKASITSWSVIGFLMSAGASSRPFPRKEIPDKTCMHCSEMFTVTWYLCDLTSRYVAIDDHALERIALLLRIKV